MRVISGKYGGRIIRPSGHLYCRPTTDRAKEGLFNILHHRLDWEGLRVLDLFAGTGSISIEFISRGVDQVVAVERDPRHTAFIRHALEVLDENHVQLLEQDVLKYLDRNKGTTPFDIIFADPPYDLDRLEELPDRILESGLLADDGLLILEHPRDYDFSEHPRFEQARHYGSVHFSFFR